MEIVRKPLELHQEVVDVRRGQFKVNMSASQNQLKVPIHFAFGHEAIAVAVASNLLNEDKLLLTHRNIHYHLALGATVENLLSEYQLRDSPISGRCLGSMNLDFPSKGVIYTSNILGNNLSIAAGIALGNKVKGLNSVTWCVTGDGAIEEGSFFESLLLSISKKLSLVFLVENNGWSLASEIADRRVEIDLNLLSQSLGIKYLRLMGNNVQYYYSQLSKIREIIQSKNQPFIVEVMLTTLGGYYVEENGMRRYVNYHAGRVRTDLVGESVIELDSRDPVYISERALESSDQSLEKK